MEKRSAILSLMTAYSPFAELEQTALRTVTGRSRPKTYATGQSVFAEGEPCRDLFVLETGRVKFFRMSTEGREQILKIFERPGDLFCIASAFSTGTHIVNATAMEETRLHLLDMDAINSVAREYPALGMKMVRMAGTHLAHLVELADDLALKSATARLAKHLYELAIGTGPAKTTNMEISRDRLRGEELASLLGTVRVHISRSLTSLVEAGAIEMDRHFIRIRDLARLQRFFESK
jgi:CRP-like cAMP-binding protein